MTRGRGGIGVGMLAMLAASSAFLACAPVDDLDAPWAVWEEPEPALPEAYGELDMRPASCNAVSFPSVHVVVMSTMGDMGDMMFPTPVDVVWWEQGDETGEAECAEETERGCLSWYAGFERSGPMTVATEFCDDVVSRSVDVPMQGDGCHVETQIVVLPVDTRHCKVPPGLALAGR